MSRIINKTYGKLPRDERVEQEIVDRFFLNDKKERVLFLLQHEKKTDRLFDAHMLKYLDANKMTVVENRMQTQQELFSTMAQQEYAYLLTKGKIGFLRYCDLAKMNCIEEFDEMILYFLNGKGYYQSHFTFGSRMRAILKSDGQ